MRKQHMLRSWIPMLLVLAMLLSACSQKPAETQPPTTQPAATPTETTAAPTEPTVSIQKEKDLLLENWFACLQVMEDIQFHVSWALDYLDAFIADNSWDSLIKARMACVAAQEYLAEYALPDYTLTDAQRETLRKAGIEEDTVFAEYLGLEQCLEAEISSLHYLELFLTGDVFFSALAEGIPAWAENYRNSLRIFREYLCLATNYLLVQMEMPDAWERMANTFPVLGQAQEAWCGDLNTLLDNCNAVLENYEKELLGMSSFVGLSEYTVAMLNEILQTSNLELYAEQMHTVDNVPFYVPIPDWLLDDVTLYYRVEDPSTGKKHLITSGQVIDRMPATCHAICGGVSLETVEAYDQQLQSWGIETEGKWTDDTKTAYHLFFYIGEASFLIEWTEKETTFLTSGTMYCLATELYMLAHYAS